MAGEGMFTRRYAPNIRERHGRHCGRSLGAGRCTCEPAYIARLSHQGTQHVETFADPADAIDWVKATRHAFRNGRPSGVAPTLEVAAQRFMQRAQRGDALTRSRKRYAANTLLAYDRNLRLHVLIHQDAPSGLTLGELPVDAIDARTIQRMVDAEITGSGPASARHSASVLSALLRDLYVQGILDTLPPKVLLPSPGPARDFVLTPPQFEQLLEGCRRDDARFKRSLLYPFVALLGASGCRVSEALALRWGAEGIDLDQATPRLLVQRDTTKSDAGYRSISLDDEIAAILRTHRDRTGKSADGEIAFLNRRGGQIARGGLVRAGMRRASALVGLPTITPHVLRHSHGTWASSENVPAVALAARLGHADPSFTLRRYAHATKSDLDAIPNAVLRHRRRIAPPDSDSHEPATLDTDLEGEEGAVARSDRRRSADSNASSLPAAREWDRDLDLDDISF